MFTASYVVCYDYKAFLVQLFVFSGINKCFPPTCSVFYDLAFSIFSMSFNSPPRLLSKWKTVYQFHFPSRSFFHPQWVLSQRIPELSWCFFLLLSLFWWEALFPGSHIFPSLDVLLPFIASWETVYNRYVFKELACLKNVLILSSHLVTCLTTEFRVGRNFPLNFKGTTSSYSSTWGCYWETNAIWFLIRCDLFSLWKLLGPLLTLGFLKSHHYGRQRVSLLMNYL